VITPLAWLRRLRRARKPRSHDHQAEAAIRHGRSELERLRHDAAHVTRQADYLRRERAKNHWSERVGNAWKGGTA